MFRPVASKPNFPELEERILEFWKEKQIFQRSVEQRSGAPLFALYEGPPTVNASPGIHHVLSRVFKDIFPRYKAMKGYRTLRKGGWDTHGLPVELEIEEELGFSSKPEIENYGVAKFNEKCRQSVYQHIKEWEKLTERIGFWIDMEHPYITCENDYIETCWWILKQFWDKGLIYQGYRVTPHCPRCGTSLSSHEVALGYKDDTPDPSIYVRFRLSSRGQPHQARNVLEKLGWDFQKSEWKAERPSFLAWTTTPWTLTANVALAVAPEETYALVQTRSPEGVSERLILAEALLDSALGPGNWEILAEFPGRELVGLHYERLYEPRPDYVVGGGALREYNWVVPADFVSMEEGTGIVHIAPAYGQEDYELGQAESLPIVHTVDLEGNIKPMGKPWDGKFVKEADPLILADLKERNLLYRHGTIRHTYPFCWRCDTPLLYYAKPSWYIKTTAKKDDLLSANAQINWYPEHIKYGRFGDWLQNNVDWAFSRERYWGTPLPAWRCESCGYPEFIGSRKELRDKSGVGPESLVQALERGELDLHRPFVDEITYACPKCGGTMRRIPEVIDCWFDSGAMPLAQWHYPFENDSIFSDGRFPAEFICEAVDQTRGWFYSLHAISVLLHGKPCFKNVICLGHILDKEGEKMSKSKGNVVDPWQVLNNYGADALRWYLITSTPAGNARRFSIEGIVEVLRRFLFTLWNTYSFFVIYANIDKFNPREVEGLEYRSELDRWILSELNLLIEEVTAEMDNYDATTAGRKIESFVDKLSNWYVRRSRRRFWKGEDDEDKRAAHATLYECLTTLAKLLAPLTPFLSEEIYQNLVRIPYPEAPESVHLTDFPTPDRTKINPRLAAETQLVMKVVGLGRAARSKAGIKVRQPLQKVVIKVRGSAEREGLERLKEQVLDELNVKQMVLTPDEGELVDFEVKPNLELLGPKYGREVATLSAALASLEPKEVALKVKAGKQVKVSGYNLLPEEIIVRSKPKPGYALAEEGEYMVGVTTEISPELAEEGLARELVHRLQTMRRSAGFDIADYIKTYYQAEETIQKVVGKFASYIKQETLSQELIESSPPEGTYTETHQIGGSKVVLGVRR